MGWKAVKEHYRIEHIVQMVGDEILIGSPYVSKLITIRTDGSLVTNSMVGMRGPLERYLEEMNADRDKLIELMQAEDRFDRSIVVYTHEEGVVLEKECERTGWPNVTHDGMLMYENAFFTDRADAVRSALSAARYRIESRGERLEEARLSLEKWQGMLSEAEEQLDRLVRENPEIARETDECPA